MFIESVQEAAAVSLPLLLFLAALFVLLRLSKSRSLVLYRVVVLLLMYSAGLHWHLIWADRRLDQRLPYALEGVDMQVEGIVASLPERSLIAQQFQFLILQSGTEFQPRKVTLNYYGDAQMAPGQRWQMTVRLNRPHGFANPGGFDYEAWLFQRGISARGYVRASGTNILLAERLGWERLLPSIRLHSLRFELREKVERLVSGAPYAGLLIALLLGDRSGISQDDWELFSATGSNHLFVISGLHIGLIGGFCYFACLQLCRLLAVGRALPAQKIAALFGLVAAFVYALLAGFTLPTQRAFIMLAVFMLGLCGNANYLMSFRLLLALAVVLLLNPLAPLSSGFWLSFVAVAALLAFATEAPRAGIADAEASLPLRNRVRDFAAAMLRPQFIVLLALSIPLIFFTQQLSLFAPLVNVVAIPIVGLIVVPLCFAALLLSVVSDSIASVLLELAHGILFLLLELMGLLLESGADTLLLRFPRFGVWQWAALAIAVLLMLLPRALCRRGLLLPLCLPLFPLPAFLESAEAGDDLLRVHIVDVGQGLAVIVETGTHTLLYDTGANLSPDFNIGSAVIAPALRAIGVSKLDAVVISHGDNDHAGGLSGLAPTMEIATLLANHSASVPGSASASCHSFDGWNWDGVTFRFLQTGLASMDENNSSCVLQLLFGEAAILLPGDIERAAETELVLRYGDALESTVLLAPHHGSLTSSSYAFLKHVRPEYVVFSSGYRNSFGHPHTSVLARYAEFESVALSTAESGMISFEFEKSGAAAGALSGVGQYRHKNRRYWH